MTTSPESITHPRRLSVSIKLGGVFLLLAVIAVGNLFVLDTIYNSLSDAARIH